MTWDEYYLNICRAVADNSKCLSRKIGAIIVRDKSIVSTGYNGPPRGVDRCDTRWDKDLKDKAYWKSRAGEGPDIAGKCPRYLIGYKSGEGLHLCIAGHAERNALINAARMGISTMGCKMYMDCGMPCIPCLIEIINAGIEEIIITDPTPYDNPHTVIMLLDESGLKWRVYECGT